MSLTEFQIAEVTLRIDTPSSVSLLSITDPEVVILAAGNVGPPGPTGKWEALTQNEYDLLTPPDPDTLYVIIQ